MAAPFAGLLLVVQRLRFLLALPESRTCDILGFSPEMLNIEQQKSSQLASITSQTNNGMDKRASLYVANFDVAIHIAAIFKEAGIRMAKKYARSATFYTALL